MWCRYLVDATKMCTWQEFEVFFTDSKNWHDREVRRVRRVGRTEKKTLKLKAEEARQGLFVIKDFAHSVLTRNNIDPSTNLKYLQIEAHCEYVKLLDTTTNWGEKELQKLDELTDKSRQLAHLAYKVSSSKFHMTSHYSDCIRNVGSIINYRCYALESLNGEVTRIWMKSNKKGFNKWGVIEMVRRQFYHWIQRSVLYQFELVDG